jgi:hypothetical protein
LKRSKAGEIKRTTTGGNGFFPSIDNLLVNSEPGLVAYYPFDGNANDVTGNSDGTEEGVTYDTGIIGQAASFDGASYIDIGSDPSLYPTSAISVAAWIKNNGSNGAYVSAWWGSGWAGYNLGTYYLGEEKAEFNVNNVLGTYDERTASITEVTDGKWHHIVGVFDGSTQKVRIYVDGVKENEADTNFASIAYDKNQCSRVLIGKVCRLDGNFNPFSGLIDELRIYNRSLSADEIAELAAPPPVTNEPPISNAGLDQTASAGSDCQVWITLDGSKSSDPDGDTLTYTWADAPENVIASVMNPDVLLGVGSHEITLTVTDGEETVSDFVVVTVNDTTAPELSGVPANVEAECDSVPEAALVTATDNCQNVVNIFEEVRTDGSFLNDYTLMRTWTATDVPGDNSNEATQVITVKDTIEPTIQSNAPTTIKPPDAPISFTATATDNCGASTVEITVYDCYKFTKKGKRIDKTGSCVVEVNGDTITILDSGGVGDHITWDVTATDVGGNTATKTFEVLVVNPGKGKK